MSKLSLKNNRSVGLETVVHHCYNNSPVVDKQTHTHTPCIGETAVNLETSQILQTQREQINPGRFLLGAPQGNSSQRVEKRSCNTTLKVQPSPPPLCNRRNESLKTLTLRHMCPVHRGTCVQYANTHTHGCLWTLRRNIPIVI